MMFFLLAFLVIVILLLIEVPVGFAFGAGALIYGLDDINAASEW